MNITFFPATVGASNRLWSWLTTFGRQFTESSAIAAQDRKVANAIKELSQFDDYQLNDIGLARSDLTPEGLTIGGARRSLQHSAIDAEVARHR